jgi:hypothetical protein
MKCTGIIFLNLEEAIKKLKLLLEEDNKTEKSA